MAAMTHKTILVVDDDEAIRSMLLELLCGEGHIVYSAEDGKEGVELARTVHPDFILMDLRLPVLDGVSAIQRLKTDPETSGIRIYAMSAQSIIGAFADQIPADGTLSKPFDLLSVLDSVEGTDARW